MFLFLIFFAGAFMYFDSTTGASQEIVSVNGRLLYQVRNAMLTDN